MDLFRRLAASVEQFVNLIDEWLRLRRGNSVFVRTCKLAGGVVWFVVAYVLIFVFTLLVEPQVNPMRAFPRRHGVTQTDSPRRAVDRKAVEHSVGHSAGQHPRVDNHLVGAGCVRVPGVGIEGKLASLSRIARVHSLRVDREPRRDHAATVCVLDFIPEHFPKAYGALRRAVQSGEPPESKRYLRKSAVIRRVKVDVQRFVERELLYVLEDQGFLPGEVIQVRYVHASTNRIDVELTCSAWPDQADMLTWEYSRPGNSWARSPTTGWISRLNDTDRSMLAAAVSGLFQRAGVEGYRGPTAADRESALCLVRLGGTVAAR